MTRASYRVVGQTEDTIYIVDTNGRVSVTNDAENVVSAVVMAYGNRKIVYRDSLGEWGELIHTNGVFTDFGPASPPVDY